MKKTIFVFSLISLLLAACDFSLAGDITPPPDAVISGQITPMPVPTPAEPADLTTGEEIYINRCAPCHGSSGLGDGEQAAQLPFFPSAIGDLELARANSPEDWYRVVSLGRLQRFMPPFGSALSAQEHWDVLAYVYSLSWDQAMLDQGRELYLLHQTEIDQLLKENSLGARLSLTKGLTLPDEDADALTAYLQAKAFGIEAGIEIIPSSTVESSPERFGSFHGQILYGGGEQIPNGLTARLYGFDHTNQIVSETGMVSADGKFSFSDIPLVSGRIFFVQVDYQGLSYFSEFITMNDQTNEFSLDVPIYETTDDPGQLAVEKIQLIFDFPKAGIARVVESVIISNLGNRAVAPTESGVPTLHFTLPSQASNLSFEEGELGERYIPDETGFGDTRAVIPGIESYSILFAYELPYNSSLNLPVHVDLPTRSVAIFLPKTNIEMQNDAFSLTGSQEINGSQYSVFVADQGYMPGDEIPLEIKGDNPLGGGASNLANNDQLFYGLLALTIAVGFAFFWLRSLPTETPPGTTRVLEQIASLDGRFESGKIKKSTYNKQRAELKEELRVAIRKQNKQK
jgi:mono/diheme cytochrome c family protein